jgi:hypothetical protein
LEQNDLPKIQKMLKDEAEDVQRYESEKGDL